MTKTHKNVIWEGRFQPIHFGHLAYIDRLLSLGEHVWIVVVANEVSTDVVSDPAVLPVPEFTRVVDPHHRPEKNLLPYWLRYRCVQDALRAQFGSSAPLTLMSGRRLDLAWNLYKNILPPDRIFLTPDRDDFEDTKARAWTKLGERCERVDVRDLPKISGTMIRERMQRGERVDGLLRPETFAQIKDAGYASALTEL